MSFSFTTWSLLIVDKLSLLVSVQVAKEYCEQLGVDGCIKIFEQFRSYEGLYFFLGSYLSSRFVIFFRVGN